MQDEVGRRKLVNVTKDLLHNFSTDEELIDPIMDGLVKTYTNQTDFVRMMVEIISDIFDAEPSEVMQEDEELCIPDAEKQWMRCLSITSYILSNIRWSDTGLPEIDTLRDTVVL